MSICNLLTRGNNENKTKNKTNNNNKKKKANLMPKEITGMLSQHKVQLEIDSAPA